MFPGDNDEHGAVIAASVLQTARGIRLLAHKVMLAQDGVDYGAGQRGYRMLTPTFVMDCALECAELGMAYLAVHCHGGRTSVAFSPDDMASHDRGYQALLDIVDGQPVGGLVFATEAAAGDIWFPDGRRTELDELVVIGRPLTYLYDQPRLSAAIADKRFDRQARLFGDRGQSLLGQVKVGVIGAGGAGSLIIEQLSHLGVRDMLVIDPDRIDPTNLSRVVGSRLADTRPLLTGPRLPIRVSDFGKDRRKTKVAIAERLVRSIDPSIKFVGLHRDVAETQIAAQLQDCDYIFLAADTMQARLVFNALVHQYLIPGIQMGVKAQVDHKSGDLLDLFAVARPVLPGQGCLWCNGLISTAKLQEEATAPEQRRRQRYVDDEDVAAPSVITLNAVGVSVATTNFLMMVTGLLSTDHFKWLKYYPRDEEPVEELPTKRSNCPECSERGRLGRGPLNRLPTKS